MNLVENGQSSSERIDPLKILVADDDALNQRLMKVLLTNEGYQVAVASNGLEAFDAIKYQQFDIVLMDLRMPVMDGLEASQRIREWEEAGRHTYIVALTASYLPEEGQTLFEAGMDNYIAKPFQMEHLQRMLKYVALARSHSSNSRTAHDSELPAPETPDVQNEQDICAER
jgi:CheY-like chemotaxis protein